MKRKAIYDNKEVEVLNIDMQNTALIVYKDGTAENIAAYLLKFLPLEQEFDNYKLSKRELFAAMAMQGLLADSEYNVGVDTTAKISVNYADALLTKLNEK